MSRPAPAPTREREPRSPAGAFAGTDRTVSARWVNLVTIAGFGLIAVAGGQAAAWIAEGFSYRQTEPHAVTSDLVHRVGFPFWGSQSMVVLLLVLVGIVVLSLPSLVRQPRTEQQNGFVRMTLVLAVTVAVVVAAGSVLAVRAELHLYVAQGRPVPPFVRVELVGFLLGVLGSAAVALFGAVVAMGLVPARR